MEIRAVAQSRQLEKISALTSLRFFAALFVVLYHMADIYMPWIRQIPALWDFIALGYTSVSFFFFLSGYILGVAYLRRGGPVAAASFYRARFARVYPLFFITLIWDAPFLFINRWSAYGLKIAVFKTAITFISNIFMIQAWFSLLRGINNPNWSLSVETLFYLIFPFLGVVLWRLRGIKLWLTFALIYLGGQALVLVLPHEITSEKIELLPFVHVTTFALGILLARWEWLKKQEKNDMARRASPGVLTLVTILALAGFGAAVYWAPGENENLRDGLLAPVFAALIWAFSHSDWSFAKVLSAPWLVVLGEASFGLYLLQVPVFHVFLALGWTRNPMLFPVYLMTAIGLSVISFYYFEGPMRRRLLKSSMIHIKETMELASDAQ